MLLCRRQRLGRRVTRTQYSSKLLPDRAIGGDSTQDTRPRLFAVITASIYKSEDYGMDIAVERNVSGHNTSARVVAVRGVHVEAMRGSSLEAVVTSVWLYGITILLHLCIQGLVHRLEVHHTKKRNSCNFTTSFQGI